MAGLHLTTRDANLLAPLRQPAYVKMDRLSPFDPPYDYPTSRMLKMALINPANPSPAINPDATA